MKVCRIVDAYKSSKKRLLDILYKEKNCQI